MKLRKTICFFSALILLAAGKAAASGYVYVLRERLDAVPASASVVGRGDIRESRSRLADGGAISLKDVCLKWDVEAGGNSFIEFWLKPDGWDGTAPAEINISHFSIGGKGYRLYKAAGRRELILEEEGSVLQSFPVYDWVEHAWASPEKEKAGWHYINIGLRDGGIRLYVDGFPSRAFSPASTAGGGLEEFTLCGCEGTVFSDLHIAKGSVSGTDLRSRYLSFYRGRPALRSTVLTVPFVENSPAADGVMEKDEYEEFTLLWGFIHNRGEEAGRFEGAGLEGYLGYDDEKLYVALKTPFEGELNAKHWGERDMPLWAEESYELFLSPPVEDAPEYLQLVGNPYGDIADFRSGREQWTGSWIWEAGIGDGEWIGEFAIPFSGIETQSPENFSVWKMNLFNSEALSAWSQARQYSAYESFGVLRFDRQGPVIRPGDIRISGGRISVPVEIISRSAMAGLIVGLEVYGADDMLPADSAAKNVSLNPGERRSADLAVSDKGMEECKIVLYVKDGGDYLFYKSGGIPFASPVSRTGN